MKSMKAQERLRQSISTVFADGTRTLARVPEFFVWGFFVWGFFVLVVLCSQSHAQENHNVHNLLMTTSSRQAMVQLQQACRLWSQQSLRSTTNEISRQYGIAIWLDRRLDPTQLVNLTQISESSRLGAELARLAGSIEADSGLIENVFVIAPHGQLARIQKSAVVLHGQLSSSGKSVAGLSKSLEWPDICSSNEFLDLIRQTWQIEIEGSVPHDLYYSGYLPECSLATQMSLLLGGFGLQATIPAANTVQLKLRPLSESTQWKDSYMRNINPQMLAELSQRFPGNSVQETPPRRLTVNGVTNLHVEILSLGIVSGRSRASNPGERQQLYSFNIEAQLPVQAVLENLSKSLQFELHWSEQCTQADRNRLIQLRVENVTREQLLEQVCEEAALRLEERENKVILHPISVTP